MQLSMQPGYYVQAAQKKETLGTSVEQMAEFMKRELTVGCDDDPDVKCGIIGEIGCSWPLYGKKLSLL